MKESEAMLRSYGYTHVFGSRDTEGEFSVWTKRDIVLVRDDRTGMVLTTVALESYGVNERVAKCSLDCHVLAYHCEAEMIDGHLPDCAVNAKRVTK